VNLRQTGITRDLLAKFLDNPRAIRAFENLDGNGTDIGVVVVAVVSAPLIGLALTDELTADRVLADGADIVKVDGGAKGNLSFALTSTGAAAASYGSATRLSRFTVDAKGRITFAADYALNSDNVTEGGTNLFFTQARARLSLSSGTGINYNNSTGVIAFAATPAANGTYASPTSITITNGIITAIS